MNGATRPLRVGLLLDEMRQPAWVCRIVDDVLGAPYAELSLVVLNTTPVVACDPRPVRQALRDDRGHVLYALYRRLDRRLFRSRRDAFAVQDLSARLDGVPVVHVAPLRRDDADHFPDDALETIARYELDVALRFGFDRLRGGALRIAEHGIWSHDRGDGLASRGAPAGFWEVVERSPTTGSSLHVLADDLDAEPRVIYRSHAKTDGRSVSRNRNNVYWKTSGFVGRKLRQLHESGADSLDDARDPERTADGMKRRTEPANAQMARLLVRLGTRTVSERLARAFHLHQWMLAYELTAESRGMETAFHELTPIVPPKDRFWADPFPVRHEGRHYIFIEELLYAHGRGWISVMPIDEKGRWQTPTKVLERDYHLSYPFMFEHEGFWYMIPETQANRTIEMYRCARFPDAWEPHTVLMSDVDAVDSTLAEIDGRYWLFANIAEPGADNYDELHVFHAGSPFGPYTPHPRNPVRSDVRAARPAGRLFRQRGELYRPAQDCSRRYGWAITFNRVDRISPTEYEEHEVSKVLPTWHPGLVSTHTFNFEGGLTVIDGRLKRRKLGP